MAVTDSQQSSGRGQCSGGGIEAIGKAFLVSVRKVVVARGREHKTAHSGCVIMTTTVEVGDGEGLGRLSK